MSRDRTKRERLDRLIPDPRGATPGYVPAVTVIDASTTVYTLVPNGSGGGAVASVTGTAPITVDNTDPANPIVTHDASGVTPGSYTSANITVDADGHVTAAANGSTGLTSPLTTKGDLWGWSTTNARVPVGVNGQVLTPDSTQTLGVKYADLNGGLSFRVGRQDGAVLLANFQRVFILPCAYDQITAGSWELYTYPGSTCSIDVQYIAFGTADPTTANSIVGATHPATSGGQTATGVTSGWTASLARGGFLAIQVLSNDLAREIRFFMPGRKVI